MAGPRDRGIGIAVGTRGITAVVPGLEKTPAVRVEANLDPNGPFDQQELTRALSFLKANLEGACGVSTDGAPIYVAVLPPLADARIISLPPLRKDEAKVVLSRDVDRYFLGSIRPGVVGVRMPRGRQGKEGVDRGSDVPVMAAAASLSHLNAIRTGLQTVGWRCGSFCPAHGAWLSGAAAVKGGATDALVAVVGPAAHVVRLANGDPVAVRRIPTADPGALADAVGPGRTVIFSDPGDFGTLSAHLAAGGSEAQRDPEGWPGAEEAAARWAATSRIEIVPPALAHQRGKRRTRMTAGLILGAAVLMVAALGVSLWGAHRELQTVRNRRAAIRDQVMPLLDARDSLEMLRTQVASLEELSRTAPVWTRSLVDLSAVLPRNTYLTVLFASGDTLEIEAAGARAGQAIQALREAGLFEEVRLLGLVERELEAGETVVERFRLWARLGGDPRIEGDRDEAGGGP